MRTSERTKRPSAESMVMAAMLLLPMAVILAACGGFAGGSIHTIDNGEVLRGYDEDAGDVLPARILYEDGMWYVAFQEYGSYAYSVCVGEELSQLQEVYSGKSYRPLRSFSLDEGRLCWTEDGDVFRILCCDVTSRKTEVIKTWEFDGFLVGPRVHVYGDDVYYIYHDTEAERAEIHKVNLTDANKKDTVISAQDHLGGTFSLVDGHLFFEGGQKGDRHELIEVDLTDGSERRITLPAGVRTVYEVDREDDLYVIYYYDERTGDNRWNENDNIGYFREGDEEAYAFYSFPDASGTYLANQDRVELHDGVVYWIYEQTVTGQVVDLYNLCAYDIDTPKVSRMLHTYDFCVDGGDLYTVHWAPDAPDWAGISREKTEALK